MSRFNVPGRAAATATLASQQSPPSRTFKIASVEYVPNADITGAATNSLTLELRNRGPDGVSINVLLAQLALVAGTDAKNRFARVITLQQTANGAPVVSDTDILEWVSVKVGTGLTDPGGTVLVNEATV